MIISGGENVFPAEVEQALMSHSDVVEAAAVGVDDEAFGQRLTAWVVLGPDAQATPEELRGHVRGSLASYKVPRDITVISELPRNAAGKVVKRDLLTGSM